MSSKNISTIEIPPGVVREDSAFATGPRWFNGNLIRWVNRTAMPVGGWVKLLTFTSAEALLGTEPNGIAFDFTDGSLCIRNNGILVFNGPIDECLAVTVVGFMASTPNGSLFNAANYLSLNLAALSGITLADYQTENTQGITYKLNNLTLASRAASSFSKAGTINDRMDLGGITNTGKAFVSSVNGGVADLHASDASWVPAANTFYTLLGAFKLNDTAGLWNGINLTADAASTPSASPTIWYIGNIQSGGSGLDGWIKGAILLPRRVPNAELASMGLMPIGSTGEAFRSSHSWKDNTALPWFTLGSANDCFVTSVGDAYVSRSIAPVDLAWNPGGRQGYGRGTYGSGAYGRPLKLDIALDKDALWSFDNFGSDLVAVHSQDGRLLRWSPSTPGTRLQAVIEAPIDNRLVIVTDERFTMVLGGQGNPRKIKWCAQEDMSDWEPTATNSAGGFDLHSSGEILGVGKFPGGILVFTDVDTHLLTFLGNPFWYGQQRITDITGIMGTNAWAATPNGVLWVGNYALWRYNGTVDKLNSPLSGEIFANANLQRKQVIFAGINEQMSEVWFMYPDASASEPNRMILDSYAKSDWWSLGEMHRTAWLNPCWQSRPFGINGRTVYEHENGWTDDGNPRDIWLESGDFSVGEADTVLKVSRVTPDRADIPLVPGADTGLGVHPYRVNFSLRDQPEREYRSYGPVTFDNVRKYTPVRFRTRLMKLRIEEVVASGWGLGKLLLRIGEGGRRG